MENNKEIRIMLVEDNPSTLYAIKDLIEDEDNLSIVAEAVNGIEAVALSKKHSPDIILMDVKMPEMDGIEATRIIKKDNQMVKIIGLTSFGSEGVEKSILEAGAVSFLDKSDISSDRLLNGIKDVVCNK
jgi:two-component system, NarL family, invasion response regulator UvrY